MKLLFNNANQPTDDELDIEAFEKEIEFIANPKFA